MITRRSTSSDPLVPGRTWQDGKRRHRNAYSRRDTDAGASVDSGKADRADDLELSDPLTDMHTATGGGFSTEAHSPVELEVCKLCYKPLPEGQRQYCGQACRREIRAARGRAARSAPWVTILPTFDLDSITLAGVGRLEVSPAEWNRLDKSDPKHVPAKPQPWFIVPNRTKHLTPAELADGWTGPRSALRLVYGNMLVTDEMVAEYQRVPERDTRTLSERADRLVRRWGTGGTPKQPCARYGCRVMPKARNVYCSEKCREAASMDSWEMVFYRMPVGRDVPRLEPVEHEPGVWASQPARPVPVPGLAA